LIDVRSRQNRKLSQETGSYDDSSAPPTSRIDGGRRWVETGQGAPLGVWQALGLSRARRIPRGQVRWIILAAFGATGVILGFIGWAQRLQVDSVGDVADAGYRTLALLGFAGAPDPPLPWTLGLARFVVPIVAGWSAIVALTVLFRNRFQLMGLPFHGGHVVVVGLGDKGLAFARSSRQKGHRVVAIERDPGAPGIKSAREIGAVVVNGDGRDPEMLGTAGVDRARVLFAVTGDDGVNAEIIVQSRGLAPSGSKMASLRLAHVQDPGLADLLRLDQLRRSDSSRLSVDYFNVDEHGARGIVARYLKGDDGTRRSPLILVGFSTLNQRVLYEAARNWHVAVAQPMPAIVLDETGGADWATFSAAEPALAAAVEPVFVTTRTALRSPRTALDADSRPLVVIDLGNDGASIKAAISLRTVGALGRATTVVVTRRSSGLHHVINALHEGELASTYGYALIDNCCNYETANMGLLEIIAQVAHEQYASERRRQGADESDPALASWHELDESLRESNRDQARHVAIKLTSIGCSIAPCRDWQPPDFTFTEEEVEKLSIMEHGRWRTEREAQGWRPGARDVGAKRTPYLVPWADLSEDIRELDREAARNIPHLLFTAGAMIRRRPGSPSDDAFVLDPSRGSL